MTPAVGTIVADRFELVRELGRGSMGTVWLAEHLTLGVRCAVKFVSAEAMGDPSYAARFELEARTIAQLNSPNVVRVLDYDMHEGVPFIAMECLQGEDLGARIRRQGRLDASSTYTLVSQVANGLAKAHAAGIVHRDLKPENIFLAQDDDSEVAKLLDFGVAKLTGPAERDAVASDTQSGTILGTPCYMSPEQARGVDEVDHRADLWSLAVVVFECVTGRLPFDGSSLGEVFAKILCEPIPVPSQIDPACSPAFDRWWARAAARDPRDRFDSAHAFTEALGRALGVLELPIELLSTLRARVSDIPRPVRSGTRRRSKLLAAALVVALAPLVVTLSSGALDARAAHGATMTRNAQAMLASSMAAAAASASTEPVVAPPIAGRAMVASSGTTAPPSAPVLRVGVVGVAAGDRHTASPSVQVRGAGELSSPRDPLVISPPSSAPPASDDVDFGI